MKKIHLILALLFLASGPVWGQERDTLTAMFWNLENFFDYRNDSTSVSDAEFSSRGARHWTKKRFYTKCNAVAKGILWTASQKGALPDIIAVAEVENSFVLGRLVNATPLKKLGYKIVHFDSPDRRGIDVGLLYRTASLEPVNFAPRHLFDADSNLMKTRDILLAQFATKSGKNLAILVNHHPSKFGGAALSYEKRKVAVKTMKIMVDSLIQQQFSTILALGDFNDTPENELFMLLNPSLVNLATPLSEKGLGTIKFAGKWELIDLIFCTQNLTSSGMEIIQIPFLQTRDKSSVGTKPLRTYSGPRYLGGVSDHCPVWIRFSL